MDAVFHALAHAHRRQMMDLVRAQPGVTVGRLASEFDVSRITVINHLGVLERAGLIVSEKDGSRRRLFLNTVPLQEIHQRWTSTFTEEGALRVLEIRAMAEAAARQRKEPAK